MVGFIAVQAICTIGLVALALEIGARYVLIDDRIEWPMRHHPSVGTTFRPNSAVTWTNGLDFRVSERTNEAGFLDRALPPIERRPGSCRIAFIGDSFVEAAQVQIPQKVQVQLQHLLASRAPDMLVETMAVGFSGTGQLNQLGYLEAWVRPRRPDLIVLVAVGNDFGNNSALLEALRTGWHPHHTPRVFATETADGIRLQPVDPDFQKHLLSFATNSPPRRLHAWLHKQSRFYRWLYSKAKLQHPAVARAMTSELNPAEQMAERVVAMTKLDPEHARLLKDWEIARHPNPDDVFATQGPLPAAFEQALRFTDFAFGEMQARAQADGTRLMVLGIHRLKKVFEHRLIGILARHGIPYVALFEHISRRGGDPVAAHFKHDGHWSSQGHLWAAEAVMEHMLREAICDTNRG